MLIEQLLRTDLVIALDMDSVTADFKAGVKKLYPEFTDNGDPKQTREMWKRIEKYQKNGGQFWLDLDPMPDFQQLMATVRNYKYFILSAAGDPKFNAENQKRQWIKNHVKDDIDVIIVRKSVDKANYAQPHIVLIDDKEKSTIPFKNAGGRVILHTSASNTIQKLKFIDQMA